MRKFHDYTLLLIIESATILFTTIGVDWVNIIYEDYTYIAIRSFIVQVFSLISLFIFVHSTSDYYIYAIITVANQGLISILNIFHVRKYCRVRFTFKMNIRKHIKPIMVLFSNNLAVSIYVNSDMTMLGWMIGDYYVGLYSVAVKIYTILKQLLAALYNVMIARLSYSAAVNIGLNIFLIPLFNHNAAAFTTLISEFLVFAILLFYTKDHYDYFNRHDIFLNLVKSFISTIPIFAFSYVFHHLIEIKDLFHNN